MTLFYQSLANRLYPRLWLSYVLFCIALLSGLFILSPKLWAAQPDHETQQDVLQFLDTYEPEIVSAERKMKLQELVVALQDKKVVFVGEQHNRYDHHLNQLAILRLMHQQNPELSIGVEWFQQSFQSILDEYLAGNIDETELLRQSGYYERWGYDYRLLRPIMVFAKENAIPVIALNAPVEITRKVSTEGFDALSPQERQQIPETINPPQETYRDYLREVFERHMGGKGDFERFVMIQRIWDETMAANIVRQLQLNPQHRMIVFAGSGHIGRGRAIPGDVARTLPAEQLVTLHSVARDEVEPGAFDYFILGDELSLPPVGKLGVWLENKENDEGGSYVAIRELAPDSAAGEAGMQVGDRFISLDQQAVASTADLLMLLANTRRGQSVSVAFSRVIAGKKAVMKKVLKLK